jgi:hypothetical protein
MADLGIKQSLVLNDSLPLLYTPIYYLDQSNNVQEGAGYLFRYRVISEDRSRVSQWSPIERVLTIEAGDSTGEVLINPNSNIINVTWGNEVQPLGYEIARNRYDVFVGFDDEEPTYNGVAYGKTYSFISTGVTNVRVIVQIESYLGARLEYLEIFDSGTVSLV